MKEEPVDILDEQGNKTGQSMLKTQAHAKGLWHGGAQIWVYNDKGEVLLQLRSPKKILRPNVWDVSVAGHIGAGKTPLETVVEEAEEELGLTVKAEDLTPLGVALVDDTYDPGPWHHRIYLWIYATRRNNIKLSELTLEEDEVSEVRWISLAQLQKDLDDPTQSKKYPPKNASAKIALREIPKLIAKGADK